MFSLAKKLSLTVRGVMASAIDNLFTALKGRATYSENIADSKQVVKDIDNYELLDKASILLTPTAYSDARVHSVKTYTGDELVNSSNWINSTSGTATITDGVITFVNGTGLLTQGIISANTTYKFSVTLSNLSLGNLRITTEGGVNDKTLSTSGVHEFYLNSTSAGALFLLPQSSFTGSIDNVSVTEADADFDFDRASSATRINSDGLVQDMQSITDPELVLNGDFEELSSEYITNGDFSDGETGWTKGGAASATQSVVNGALVMYAGSASDANNSLSRTNTPQGYNGKTYKLELTVSDMLVSSTGFIRLDSTYDASNIISFGTGTSTIYFTAYRDFTHIRFFAGSAEDGYTIDNVSVQQVDPNDRWSAGAKWTIANGVARLVSSDSSGSGFIQSSVFTIGNTYNITFDAVVVSGSAKVEALGGATLIEIDETKTYNHTFVADRTDLYFNRVTYVSDISLDNISVKDITFSEDVDLARINYDSNGENGHWLLEPTSTNLIPYSEDFSQWSNARTTDTSNQATSPDGTNNATYFEQNSGETTAGSVYVSSTISSGTNTLSVFAKKKEKDFIVLYDTNAARTYFDLNNGSVGTTPSGVTANIENYGNGWYRCSVTFTVSSSGAQNTAFYLADNDSAAPIADSGGIYIWGAQLEALSYATSYIPTLTGSTVTRATETLNGSGNSTLINSTEGVLYAEIAALANDLTRRIITITDGTLNSIVKLEYKNTSNQIEAVLYNGNTECLILHTLSDETEFNKIAFKYKQDDFSLFVNGIKVGTDTSGDVFTANTLNDLSFYQGNANNLFGKLKALAVFDEALTDDELELLTGITNYGSFNELAQANGYTII